MRGAAWGGGLVLAGATVACGSFAGGISCAGTLPLPATPPSTTSPSVPLQSAPPQNTAPQAERFLFFSGYDAWRSGSFGHGGLMWSPRGLDNEGFIARFMAGAGTYNYLAGTTTTTGYVTLLDAAPGWHFKRGGIDLTVYAGLDIQNHRLRPNDPGNRSRGTNLGARIGADLWTEPTAATMASVSVSFATVGNSYWSRLAYGARLFDKFYLGPEVHAIGDDTYQQWRLGTHLTALKIGGYEWSAGAGVVEDSDEHSGIYGRIGVLLRR